MLMELPEIDPAPSQRLTADLLGCSDIPFQRLTDDLLGSSDIVLGMRRRTGSNGTESSISTDSYSSGPDSSHISRQSSLEPGSEPIPTDRSPRDFLGRSEALRLYSLSLQTPPLSRIGSNAALDLSSLPAPPLQREASAMAATPSLAERQFAENGAAPVRPVDPELLCPLCYDILRNPMCCNHGHVFCNSCIQKWLSQSGACPLDRRPLSPEQLVPNLPLKGLISRIQVRCPSWTGSEDGKRRRLPDTVKATGTRDASRDACTWVGAQEQAAIHVSMCPFGEVHCPNKGCDLQLQRRQLDTHLRHCKERIVSCLHCGKRRAVSQLARHIGSKCPLVEVACTHAAKGSCKWKGKRSNLDQHLKEECLLQELPCLFKNNGCTVKLPRDQLKDHLMSAITEHMLLVAAENVKLKMRLEELDQACGTIEERVLNLETVTNVSLEDDDSDDSEDTHRRGALATDSEDEDTGASPDSPMFCH